DHILAHILKDCDVYELMKLRLVSTRWMKVVTSSPDVLHVLDLTPYNRYVTDNVLGNVIAPFAGTRPREVDISNCFHVTDDGFAALANVCAPSVRMWKMKSVWDITGQAVLDMTNKAKGLEEIDLSNCRKVGDNLLARVVGWVVPELSPMEQAAQREYTQQQQQLLLPGAAPASPAPGTAVAAVARALRSPSATPAPGTVVGCPRLRRLTLSYCKHITDRSMAHIATHAAQRIEAIDLTRCTTITDAGFHSWSVWSFPRLTKLCLADCTYLTDNAIVWLTHAARGLRWLDLVRLPLLSLRVIG
ncbi:MAG TPA: F-box protein, partial [Burkholderiaceae bacterium]|nr:F-box protein [Burkholderiaceae bacterium]